jgi:transcriptional regulator with XRE-family HTH domain
MNKPRTKLVPPNANKELANWCKTIRKSSLNLTQKELAERANIPLGTLRYFEQTGRTSLQNFLRIATELHALEPFMALVRGEEPVTVHKIQKEKTIARLRDELAMQRGEVSPMDMRKRNTRISKPVRKWKLSSQKEWLKAEA